MAIVIGCVIGAIIGLNIPIIPYSASGYLAIAIVAALDSVFGGITSILNKNFDMKIFLSGFFVNAILAMLLTFLGEKLNVDIYLAAVVVFVGRMFLNLALIRRYCIDKLSSKKDTNSKKVNEEI
ncbi:MAG: small basic family protein [Clostridia bacterium]|nr:small basic family protein [Clostridia bacterium]